MFRDRRLRSVGQCGNDDNFKKRCSQCYVLCMLPSFNIQFFTSSYPSLTSVETEPYHPLPIVNVLS